MKGYAYLDQYGIIQGTTELKGAQEPGEKYVETDLCGKYGHIYENGTEVFVYTAEKEFYEGGNSKAGTSIDENTLKTKYPGVYQLYQKLG